MPRTNELIPPVGGDLIEETLAANEPEPVPVGIVEVADINPAVSEEIHPQKTEFSEILPEYPLPDELNNLTPAEELKEHPDKQKPMRKESREELPAVFGGDSEAERPENQVFESQTEPEDGAGDASVEDVAEDLADEDAAEAEIELVYGRTRLISDIAKTSELQIDGSGWVYTGGEPEGGTFRMRSRTLEEDSTVFSFYFPETGDYRLFFIRQDLVKGSFARMEMDVEVLSEEDFNSASEGEDDVQSVLSTVLDEDSPPENAVPCPEHIEVFLAAADKGEFGLFDSFWEQFLEKYGVNDITDDDYQIISETTDLLLESNKYFHAESSLEFLLENAAFYKKDEIYFRLGAFYEIQSPLRDEKKAMEYYSLLTNQYPASIFWEDADKRRKYLNRHFFHIR